MILISHRGNINGSFPLFENSPDYVDLSINKGYNVEVDVWYFNNFLHLGHDYPQYKINLEWFENRIDKLWIHCKNIESIIFFKNLNLNFNYFWHENDTLTLTSKSYIWVYPGKQPIKNSISVMPELNNDDISECLGICSDYIEKYNLNQK
jgi:hypothetical protein